MAILYYPEGHRFFANFKMKIDLVQEINLLMINFIYFMFVNHVEVEVIVQYWLTTLQQHFECTKFFSVEVKYTCLH